jgi:cytochrome c oxidase subunit 3
VSETEFQYEDAVHQSETALAGLWLFLASEILFFGGLFLSWVIYRQAHTAGFNEASRESNLLIGSINTVILFTSSALFSAALPAAKKGRNRTVMWLSLLTCAMGIAFIALKLLEWAVDLSKNLFPGPHFALTGMSAGGAQLFYVFYFVATGLHGLHMLIGIGLVGWIAFLARRRGFTSGRATSVEVVGIYWSFVDIIWLILYPLIYLSGRV